MLFKFWQISKPFYVACLIPIIIYFSMNIFQLFFGQAHSTAVILIGPLVACFLFFLLGLFIFIYLPSHFRRRIMMLAYRYEEAEDIFILEEWEVLSSNFQTYLGFDCQKKKLLFVESMPAAGIAFGFEEISGYELNEPPRGDALFSIITNNMRCPLIRFSIPGDRVKEWRKKMEEIFRIRVQG